MVGELYVMHVSAGNLLIWISHNIICGLAGFSAVLAVFLVLLKISNSEISLFRIETI